MEWPLPLWLVLREELPERRRKSMLRAEAFAAIAQDVIPPTRDESAKYLFSSRCVIDLGRLSKKLTARAPELKTILTPAKPAAAEVKPLAAVATFRATPKEVRADDAYDTETLNRLLVTRDLYKAFPDLAESRWIEKQNPDTLPESKLIELNRYLLDRAFAGAIYPADEKILPEVVEELHQAKLSALCFSAGGIRSATFCLEVVQSLPRPCLLDKSDSLSTFSDAAYVGGCLARWTHWNQDGLSRLVSELNTASAS